MPLATNRENAIPVIIGGLGGSGTRVVAEILIALGWPLGNDLNSAKDNQLFTLLFKRPKWHQDSSVTSSQIQECLRLFENVMTGKRIERNEWSLIAGAVGDAMRYGHDYSSSKRSNRAYRAASRYLWPLMRVWKLLMYERGVPGVPAQWGWKEPNTHVYLEHLIRHFPNMRYIHVIRHGMDMAFSGNQAQLFNWGHLFGVVPPVAASTSSPNFTRCALDYWINANNRAITVGRELLGRRFLLLNYDALCARPEPMIRELCAFLDHPADDQKIAKLAMIPKVSATTGRYQRYEINIFTPEQLSAVRQLGFTL